LGVLAKEPETEVNRLPVAELRVNEYLRPDVVALRSSLERLSNVVSTEAEKRSGEGFFWSGVRDYVNSYLSKTSGSSMTPPE